VLISERARQNPVARHVSCLLVSYKVYSLCYHLHLCRRIIRVIPRAHYCNNNFIEFLLLCGSLGAQLQVETNKSQKCLHVNDDDEIDTRLAGSRLQASRVTVTGMTGDDNPVSVSSLTPL
jgi:hypothetical protein